MIQSCGVDVYPGDRRCDWAAYIAAGDPWRFAYFKLTQGLDYEYSGWAARQRPLFVASPRYGVSLWDGFYHYLTFHQPGDHQADRFWAMMAIVGGELNGTLPAMVDVERGGQRIASPSKAQVEDTTAAFAARYRSLSGRSPILYGGELLRSVGTATRLGCGWSAIALYGPSLPEKIVTATGTDEAHLALWQYHGAGEHSTPPSGYPTVAPGCGSVDISVCVAAGGVASLT